MLAYESATNGNNHDTNGELSTEDKKYAVFLKNCCFARPPSLSMTLKNVSLREISLAIRRGELIGIIGGMASGKSTLMSALCGEIKRTRGTFHMFDRSVYVPNSPWLKSGTIRDNILFGNSSTQNAVTHRSKLYEKVMNYCHT